MQRLERLHAHLCTGPRAALQRSLAIAEPAADENAGLKLLTDRQLKDFLIDGVAVIPVEGPPPVLARGLLREGDGAARPHGESAEPSAAE